MFRALAVGACLFSASVCGAQINAPGKAIFWSPGDGASSKSTYKTQTTSVDDVATLLKNEANDKEILLMLCSDNDETRDFYQSPSISASIQSGDATILPNVYHSVDTSVQNICQKFTESNTFDNIRSMSASDVVNVLSQSKELLSNGVLDSFVINVPRDVSTDESFKDLFDLAMSEGNALFVALQNPAGVAPETAGNYNRLLMSDISEGDNYLPEGTEFSIYSQNTYLYLTPDIFTGLMTGLFMFFVLLIGFNCLGAIQGPATFAKTMPALGKEG